MNQVEVNKRDRDFSPLTMIENDQRKQIIRYYGKTMRPIKKCPGVKVLRNTILHEDQSQ